MAQLSENEIAELLRVSAENKGHCDRCHRPLKIYKYTANKQIAVILLRMQAEEVAKGSHEIDLNTLPLNYSILTQRSKARLHGLIVQIKNADKTKKASIWRITTKGYQFLNGVPIPTKVLVFDNQVIGHEGGTIDIAGLTSEADYGEEEITTPEADVYHDVRPKWEPTTMSAMFRRNTYGMTQFIDGDVYELEMDRLQVGKPVKVRVGGRDIEYKDIASFQKDWQIINNPEN